VTPWTDAAWLDEVCDWVRARLTALGLTSTGPVEQPHVMPWSTALRVPTDQGPVWFKANAAGSLYEAPVAQLLLQHRVPHVLQPLAVDTARGWLLLPDGGPTLRTQERDISVWEQVLPAYAELQRATADVADELVAAGAPDLRPARLPAVLDGLLADPEWLMLGQPDGITPERLTAVRGLRGNYASWCAELADSAVPATLQHDDLHDNNVLGSDGAWVFFDWSDACVAHPFGTLLVALRSAAHRRSLAADAPGVLRMRDAYLEAWTDLHDRRELLHLLRLAMRTAKVGRALSWQSSLAHLPPEQRGEDAAAVGGWVDDLLEPDPF